MFGSTLDMVSPESLCFEIFSQEEVKKMCVVTLTNPIAVNQLGHMNSGSVYDLKMGLGNYESGLCATCKQSITNCSGHVGLIELPLPVINPVFFPTLVKLLKCMCIHCFKLKVKPILSVKFQAQMKLLSHGLSEEAKEVDLIAGHIDLEDEEVEKTEDEEVGKTKDEEGKVSTEKQNKQINEALKLESKLHKFVRKSLKGIHGDSSEMVCNKNVVGLKLDIINEYFKMANKKKCSTCKCSATIDVHNSRIYIYRHGSKAANIPMYETPKPEDNNEEEIPKINKQVYLTAEKIRSCLRVLYQNEPITLNYLFSMLDKTHPNPTDAFFMDCVVVPPPRTRPLLHRAGFVQQHPQSVSYTEIINDCVLMKALSTHMKDKENSHPELKQLIDELPGKTAAIKLERVWLDLQNHVNALYDSDSNQKDKKKQGTGIKQIIEKKEGLFRMHMMGKRVNYAARSVIAPDPMIAVDEIGVPDVFAKKLTYPVTVTPWNAHFLKQAILNGPDIYPGATLIEYENGKCIRLPRDRPRQRVALANQILSPLEAGKLNEKRKIVHRHLLNGDYVLVNRQPTLHKPSIMAHRVRVLMGNKTLRLHYANCKSYNADFDGDEMNIHFPQNEIAKSEAANIVNVCDQYLVPKDGTPLSGLIQDHVIAGVKLTIRGKFFNREDYLQLVYTSLIHHCGPIELLPPTILKPRVLWSGKQVISTLLINITPRDKGLITLTSKTKISDKDWESEAPRPWIHGGTPLTSDAPMSESHVIIRDSELLCGVFDKTHCGATQYGIVHGFYELYGSEYSAKLLTSFSRLFTYFLQLEGFTLGIKDVLLSSKANKKRRKMVHSLETDNQSGDAVAAEVFGVRDKQDKVLISEKYRQAHLNSDQKGIVNLDRAMKKESDDFNNEINKFCMPQGLLCRFPENNLQLMVQSGAKGSKVNAMQISCLLGQIELEGKRPPLMASGKSLPSFLPYDTSPRAGGFIAGRFLTGIKPQEFFFHCMAGREGLIDTAVKTSRSGYLQRCLIKHLEGLVVNYDLTVRDSDGTVVQFMYGEDGMDISKVGYLNKNQMSFLIENQESMLKDKEVNVGLRKDCKEVKKLRKKIKKWKKIKETNGTRRSSGFINFCRNIDTADFSLTKKNPYYDSWFELPQEKRKELSEKFSQICPGPVNGQCRSDLNFGVVNERLESIIESYIEQNPGGHLICDEGRSEEENYRKLDVDKFRNMMYWKALACMCVPGEAVGILAAQSVGEPSTQMTLNTFHFAGRGEMNVTLGIPRLREILMIASANIKTPSMDIPLRTNVPGAREKLEKIKLKLNAVTLAQVLQEVYVTERLNCLEEKGSRTYEIHFCFLPHRCYKHQFALKPKNILHFMENVFFPRYLIPMMKSMGKFTSNKLESREEKVKKSKVNDEDESEESPKAGEETHFVEPDSESELDVPVGDEDATDKMTRQKHTDEKEYEDDDEDANLDEDNLTVDTEMDRSLIEDEGFNESELHSHNDSASQADTEASAPSSGFHSSSEMLHDDEIVCESTAKLKFSDREKAVLGINECVVDYKFDVSKEQWCKITLQFNIEHSKVDLSMKLKNLAEKAKIQEIPGIKKAFIIEEKGGIPILKTEGLNFRALFKYDDFLDMTKIYSNNIHEVANTFGIEAARMTIVKEIQNVFGVYGIRVDPRHLTLIADYLTYDGTYRAFNRSGMKNSASPLQQISFETSMQFLKNATINSIEDLLKNPSSRIVLGLPTSGGTGLFSLIQVF